jgi:hypothetical protein
MATPSLGLISKIDRASMLLELDVARKRAIEAVMAWGYAVGDAAKKAWPQPM